MSDLTPAGRSRYVRDVFSRIAPRYDLMNRLMSVGQDQSWRREVIRLARLQPGARLLDLGAGTGDLTRQALHDCPDIHPLAADFTLEMMQSGRKHSPETIEWAGVDALHVPFPKNTFDAIVSGFLLRNVADLPLALREQHRVLKPGGRWVALDTTRPRPGLFSPLVWLQFHVIIPVLGWLLTGQRDAYQYLPQSTEHFLRAEQLAAHLAAAGFREVGFRRFMFGTIAIHWARK